MLYGEHEEAIHACGTARGLSRISLAVIADAELTAKDRTELLSLCWSRRNDLRPKKAPPGGPNLRAAKNSVQTT